MNRKDYDRLVVDMSNGYLNHELEPEHFAINALNNVLIAEGIDIPEPEPKPVSEQKWHYEEAAGIDCWYITDDDDNYVAKAYGVDMRDYICGVPELVKQAENVRDYYSEQLQTRGLVNALQAMGLGDE